MATMYGEVGGCFTALRIVTLIFALIHTLLRGVQLVMDLISSIFMIVPIIYGAPDTADLLYMSEEAKRVIWKAPYPPLWESFGTQQNITGRQDQDRIQLKSDLHIWIPHVVMQLTIFVFGWMLIVSVKKKYYGGTLAWLSFSIPIFLTSLVHFVLDVSFMDYMSRPLPSQIVQGFDIILQPIGLILVACFLRQLYEKYDEIRQIDRYNEQNGFSGGTGGVTITQILESDSC